LPFFLQYSTFYCVSLLSTHLQHHTFYSISLISIDTLLSAVHCLLISIAILLTAQHFLFCLVATLLAAQHFLLGPHLLANRIKGIVQMDNCAKQYKADKAPQRGMIWDGKTYWKLSTVAIGHGKWDIDLPMTETESKEIQRQMRHYGDSGNNVASRLHCHVDSGNEVVGHTMELTTTIATASVIPEILNNIRWPPTSMEVSSAEEVD
jgi:hypothetical protein